MKMLENKSQSMLAFPLLRPRPLSPKHSWGEELENQDSSPITTREPSHVSLPSRVLNTLRPSKSLKKIEVHEVIRLWLGPI